ncbi:purine catabolism regulator [Anaerosolibacter carboniphilus]|uniref:Purine catabolism regulator n=1 Tax=Anaerosolibacter carboniphilus TaxID=1417629 RepID=A0A841KYE9_9FIRM|nr:PucR family transcriptional regulator ligand-binding domain-containing protein [Anaerosolibacter carboniphilus]MBB6215155.1 purine catabolism regulator [Anaerosolibacter carboniphilus]
MILQESGITIRQALEMDCLDKSKIIAGHNGIDNTITRLNIMADPDILHWVNEGELLLTTAYSFRKDDIELQKKLIMECSKKKLAGIGIKIYPYIDGLSKEVIDLADALGFPIIDLHYATAFTDIMTPIFKEIFNKQATLLQRMEAVHNDLMAVVLKGGGIREIIRTLKQTIKNPIIVRDHHFDEYIYHADRNETIDYKHLIERSSLFFENNHENKKMDTKTEKLDILDERSVKKVMIPIIVKGNVQGHILVWDIVRPISNLDKVALESASTIIALEFLKKSSVYEVEHRYKLEFFESLISSDERRKAAAISRGNIYKLDPNGWYQVLNIRLLNIWDSDKKKKQEPLDSLKAKFILNLEKILHHEQWHGLMISKEEKISILTMFSNEKESHHRTKKYGNRIERLCKEIFKEGNFVIGVGRNYGGLEHVYKSMNDADRAIEAGILLNKDKMIYFEDLGVYKILCHDSLREELNSFYQQTLEALVAYDRCKNTELLKTLQVYFETNGNLKKMSELLFTHYNTILYRVQRIKQITGRDVDNAEDRFDLETALKIMKILKCS